MRMGFETYLRRFEQDVICEGVKRGVLGQKEMVAVRNGKLCKTEFGKLLGFELAFDCPLAIDYYGFMKKSTGFRAMLSETRSQVRMIECDVVHFASVKMEDIVEIAPKLVAEFPVFKKQMLEKRGFKK
jgi:hypothetical protein